MKLLSESGIVAVWISVLACCAPALAADYFVDSAAGFDGAAGTKPSLAWQTLERVNQHQFQPGDTLFFKAGSQFKGQFKPQGSGAVAQGQTNWIRVAMFGQGARPRIDADGKFLDAVLLRNVEFWDVADLEVTNVGTNREPWRTGVHIVTDGFGAMRGIRLHNLYVHDVNGDLRKSHEGCGIYFESRGGNASHFDGLTIENCFVSRTDRNGICQRSGSRARSLGVVIRGNRLDGIGGDGIKIWGSNGALVEYNVLHGGRMRCDDYAAGIWPFDSDDTLIQFNEVSGMKGTKDGQGFDADYSCRRSVFQYNYSHDNEGGFFLICGPGNSYNEDTIIRYNISQNDGINTARVFHFGGGSRNTRIYNNTIYVGPQQDLPLILCGEWDGGVPRDAVIENNIFYVDGRVTYDLSKSRNMVFNRNVFFGNHVGMPPDTNAITARPPLANPGGAADGFRSLAAYQFRAGTRFPSGVILPNNGGRDLLGTPLSTNSPPRLGALERQGYGFF